MHGLAPKRGLQAVGNMRRNLFVHPNRHLATVFVECRCAIQCPLDRALVAQQFHQRNKMWWIEGVPQDETIGISPAGLQITQMPEGVRQRSSGGKRFVFNYSAEAREFQGQQLPPASVQWD